MNIKIVKSLILAVILCAVLAVLPSCENSAGNNSSQPENTQNTEPAENTETEEERLRREEEERRRREIEENTNENNTVLTETRPAGQDYIDETLFLGDSNTVRFMYTADENGKTFTTAKNTIAVSSMGVERISSLACMQFSTGTFTMVKSVSILQPRRIIITFGTNNLGDSPTAFAGKYERQLKAIEKAYPQADLIVNSIPPSASFCKYKFPKNDTILAFNEQIQALCEKNGWHYLNTHEVLYDPETGYAFPECFASDGLHLNREGVERVFEYIMSHALYTEDRREKPLKSIPKIYGALYNMLLEKDDEDDPDGNAADNTVDPADNTVDPADNTVDPADNTVCPPDNTVDPADNTVDPADNADPGEGGQPADDQTPGEDQPPADDQTPGENQPSADDQTPGEDQPPADGGSDTPTEPPADGGNDAPAEPSADSENNSSENP